MKRLFRSVIAVVLALFMLLSTASALTVEELQTMNETDIMIKFMEESFSYTPNEDQLEIFRDALAKSEEEGDLG